MVNSVVLWASEISSSRIFQTPGGRLVGKVEQAYVRCPACRYIFRAPRVGAYFTVGRETDLCPKFPGRVSDASRLMQSAITMCPACSFASQEEFNDLDLAPDERHDVEERLGEDGLLRVFRTNPPPWLAFHAAEICGQERGYRARALGDICLRASWVCRKEKEQPFESTFQLRAVRYLMRAPRKRRALRSRALRNYLPRRRAKPPPRAPPRGAQLVRQRRTHPEGREARLARPAHLPTEQARPRAGRLKPGGFSAP